MSDIFLNVAIVLALTSVVAIIFSRLRQPLVLAYIFVGILAASSGLTNKIGADSLNFFSELGIAFALFLIGLELKFSELKQLSKAAIYVGLGQVVFTAFFGFLIALRLGFASTASVFLGLGLAFSSTLIVVQLLGEKRDLDSLYGKITTGYLIVQDFIAVGALIFVTSFGRGGGSGGFLLTVGQGALLVFLILILNRYVLQNLFDVIAKNTELLFLTSVTWAILFAAIFTKLGFSIEIGAFLAGLGLATLREEVQIASWIRPLRNLFIILFFLGLGLYLPLESIFSNLWPILLFSSFVLVANPLSVMIIMGFLGFRRRTSFQVGVTSAQISEFSLILVFLGFRLGLVEKPVVNTTVAVALLTIVLSTYIITYSTKIYSFLSPYLKIFQRKSLVEISKEVEILDDHIILVGAGRLGRNILVGLRKKGFATLVIDFDPTVVKKLESEEIPVIYGDVSDPEILEEASLTKAKLLISTVFDSEDTNAILSELKRLGKKIPVVVTSPLADQALEYYKSGAAYVIVPRILSSHLIERFIVGSEFEDLVNGNLRKEHVEELSNLTKPF